MAGTLPLLAVYAIDWLVGCCQFDCIGPDGGIIHPPLQWVDKPVISKGYTSGFESRPGRLFGLAQFGEKMGPMSLFSLGKLGRNIGHSDGRSVLYRMGNVE